MCKVPCTGTVLGLIKNNFKSFTLVLKMKMQKKKNNNKKKVFKNNFSKYYFSLNVYEIKIIKFQPWKTCIDL